VVESGVVNPPLAEGHRAIKITSCALRNVKYTIFAPKATLFELECSYDELRHKDW
jgi:hypothetical protein